MTKIKAYSYLRISTDQQRVGDGIRRQMEASKAYAKQHDYELVETMSDIGMSAFKGKNVKEGALGVFIAAIDVGNIDTGSVLLVESLDRLSRDNVLTAFAQFTSILEKGVGIVTLTDEQHYTAESVSQNVGQLFTSLGVMLRANEESVIKSKRISAAWARKREEIGNKKLTSNVPAWMSLSDDRQEILVDNAKAAIVRKIFELSVGGMGLFSITRHLNDNSDKYPPISAAIKWNQSFVAKIINNPAVYGMFQPHSRSTGKSVAIGDPVSDYYPAIISKDTFNLAQARMKSRDIKGAGRKGETFTNLFSGLIKCATCGGTVTLRSKYSKGKGGYKYLRCNNSLEGASCTAPAWRYDEFEASFIKFVREVKFVDVFSDNDTGAKKQNLEAQKATSTEQLAELERKFDTLIAQFETDLPISLRTRLVTRSQELEAAIAVETKNLSNLEAAIVELSTKNIEGEQIEFLAAYDAIENITDKTKLREIRYAMHGLLCRSVKNIIMHNDFTINPWEAFDVISAKLGDEVLTRTRIKSADELEDYFSKPHGKRAYTKSERYMLVKFSNGMSRVVKPYDDKTYLPVSAKMAALRKSRN